MKLLVVCLLSLVVMAMAETETQETKKPHNRGCRYILDKCVEDCPEGTHAYTTGCSRKLPEATCDKPQPELEVGVLCDYSSCYCDPPTVRDETSNKCVKLEECPKKD